MFLFISIPPQPPPKDLYNSIAQDEARVKDNSKQVPPPTPDIISAFFNKYIIPKIGLIQNELFTNIVKLSKDGKIKLTQDQVRALETAQRDPARINLPILSQIAGLTSDFVERTLKQKYKITGEEYTVLIELLESLKNNGTLSLKNFLGNATVLSYLTAPEKIARTKSLFSAVVDLAMQSTEALVNAPQNNNKMLQEMAKLAVNAVTTLVKGGELPLSSFALRVASYILKGFPRTWTA